MPSMVNWRAKQIKKGNKGSQTPGKVKGANCHTDGQKKFFFTSPKAYKHRDYAAWHQKSKDLNKGART